MTKTLSFAEPDLIVKFERRCCAHMFTYLLCGCDACAILRKEFGELAVKPVGYATITGVIKDAGTITLTPNDYIFKAGDSK